MIPIFSLLHMQYNLLTISDYGEILFFSGIVYAISLWLAQDTQKNLLIYFYSYCFLLTGAYCVQLHAISFFLTFFAPLIFICFVIIHEKTLQKNYITLRKVNLNHKPATQDWVNLLIRTCMHAMHKKIALTFVIEQHDTLSTLLNSTYLNVNLQTGILDVLINSTTFDHTKIIWIHRSGTLVGVHSQWKLNADNNTIIDAATQTDQCIDNALLYTHKTDALFFRSNPTSHTFDLIVHGVLYESVNAHGLITSLKNHQTTDKTLSKGEVYDSPSHTRTQKEHNA